MEEGDIFLIADVGGTKALLFLVRYEKTGPKKIRKELFLCKNYTSLDEIVAEFLQDEKEVCYAVIGVAGAVTGGRCSLTNLSWHVDEKKIEELFCMKKVVLVNDVELLGSGLEGVSKSDLLILQKGKEKKGAVKSLLSVGTGLGEGVVLPDRVLPTEGGHCDFAPTSEEGIEFLSWAQERFGHVSYERVLSGAGIVSVYEFFTKKRNLSPEEIFAEEGGNKAVSFFLNVLGNEAANLVLRSLSLGGIYLSGGVLEKNELLLQREDLLDAFYEKGRFKCLLRDVQVSLITGNSATLFGGWKMLGNRVKTRNNKR